MFSSSKNERVRVSKTSTVIVLTTNHADWTPSKAIFGGNLVCRLVHTFQQWRKRRWQQSSLRARARVREGAREKEKEKAERKRKIREKKIGKEKRKERENKLHTHTRTTTTQQHTHTHHHNTPAHHTTHQTTDRDLESVFVKRKVNAWICACQTTDRDLESVFVKRKVNAWIRAKCLFYLKL